VVVERRVMDPTRSKAANSCVWPAGRVLTARPGPQYRVGQRSTAMTADDCAELEDLPNVGPATAADFRLLGITRPGQLKGKDPYRLYERLCELTGVRHDPCVIDVFIAATRFMDGDP